MVFEASEAAGPGVPAGLAGVGERTDRRIGDLLSAEERRWGDADPDLREPLTALRELVLAGGKRLRPAFCYWAFVGAGGEPDDPAVVDVGAALELLHTFALVHDDIMDGSRWRRGAPTVHERFTARHAERAWQGEGRRFGEGAAILVGDFAFVYADVLMARTSPEVRSLFDELRLELCVGQYLDLVGTASRTGDPERARRIERFKSAKYTVERPLHLGAALAGRFDELAGPLSAVGLPLGEAFQLRDDLLGVFGDTTITGKPVGDDLREGKLTPLVAIATQRADARQREVLGFLGHPDLGEDDLAALRTTLVDTGACDEVEEAIGRLVDEGLDALASVPIVESARDALADLGRFVAWRDR
ncbi:MAG: polyprenyl synthetase family protein [Acidimicrobiia bacterium]|nr:polyprenyl synthetase family protein [Acidimicrobiia bacterium]